MFESCECFRNLQSGGNKHLQSDQEKSLVMLNLGSRWIQPCPISKSGFTLPTVRLEMV